MSFKFAQTDAAVLQAAVLQARPGLVAVARVVDHDTVLLLDLHAEDGRAYSRLGVKAEGAPLDKVLARFLRTLEVEGA